MRANLDVQIGRASFRGDFQQVIDVHESPQGARNI
jgi:hypothetical protein